MHECFLSKESCKNTESGEIPTSDQIMALNGISGSNDDPIPLESVCFHLSHFLRKHTVFNHVSNIASSPEVFQSFRTCKSKVFAYNAIG